jgi:hypothetical protein
MKAQFKLCLLTATTLLAGNAFAFTVGNKMEGGLAAVKESLKLVHRHMNLSGHEEITRQAIILATKAAKKNNILIPKELADMAFQNLQPDKFGLIGSEATNPLIQGNYATDFPFTRKDYAVDLPKYWKFNDVKDNMDWQNHPKTQKFHFLRDHLDKPDKHGSILVGQRQSCIASRNTIIKVTKEVSRIMRTPTISPKERATNVKKALFLIGHATHILQDSFSEAHGKRASRKSNNDVTEMCYFGFDTDIIKHPVDHETRLNSCHHSVDEIIRDGLWLKDSKGIQRVKKEWPNEPVIEDSNSGVYTCLKNFTLKLTDNDTCMKHTPRLARTATAKYLLVMMEYMKVDNATVAQKGHLDNYLIDNFFEGSLGLKGLDETMPNGVMRCDQLPD